MLFLASEGKINKTLKAIALGDKELSRTSFTFLWPM